MSMNGYRKAQLERERREQLRLKQLREQGRAMLTSCQNTIRTVTDPAVQQLTAGDLKEIQKSLNQVSGQIESSPQQAKRDIGTLKNRLNKVIAGAEASTHKWAKQQARAKATIESARQSLQAQKESANEAAKETLTMAQRKIDQALQLYKQGSYKEVSGLCQKATDLSEEAGQKSFDESVRREVVSGLLSTLMNMGFVVGPPQLEGDDQATGVVKLVGKMPSGRRASFQVNLEGRMDFDFDGYEGRACAKEMDLIDRTLQEQFSVKLGEAQVTWKNPDKIAKGALNEPAGNRTTANY